MTTPEILDRATENRRLSEKFYRIVCREFGSGALISRISEMGLKKANARERDLINKQYKK